MVILLQQFKVNVKPRLHDTTGCQTRCQSGCQTSLTTGSIVYTNIQPVVIPVWQPVWQTAVSCSLYSRLSNRLYNRFNNRLYRVNGVLETGINSIINLLGLCWLDLVTSGETAWASVCVGHCWNRKWSDETGSCRDAWRVSMRAESFRLRAAVPGSPHANVLDETHGIVIVWRRWN